jgi:hypothetical protein
MRRKSELNLSGNIEINETAFFAATFAACLFAIAAVAWLLIENQALIDGGLV